MLYLYKGLVFSRISFGCVGKLINLLIKFFINIIYKGPYNYKCVDKSMQWFYYLLGITNSKFSLKLSNLLSWCTFSFCLHDFLTVLQHWSRNIFYLPKLRSPQSILHCNSSLVYILLMLTPVNALHWPAPQSLYWSCLCFCNCDCWMVSVHHCAAGSLSGTDSRCAPQPPSPGTVRPLGPPEEGGLHRHWSCRPPLCRTSGRSWRELLHL